MYMWCFYFPGKPDDNVSNYIHGVLKVSLKKTYSAQITTYSILSCFMVIKVHFTIYFALMWVTKVDRKQCLPNVCLLTHRHVCYIGKLCNFYMLKEAKDPIISYKNDRVL